MEQCDLDDAVFEARVSVSIRVGPVTVRREARAGPPE